MPSSWSSRQQRAVPASLLDELLLFWRSILRRRLSWGLIPAICLASSAIALLGSQILLVQQDRARLHDYVQEVLLRADQIAQESQRVLSESQRIGNAPLCSAADLRALRLLLINARFISDIGRVQQDTVVCSANWGQIEQPRLLPPTLPPDVYGVQFWHSIGDILAPQLTSDLVRLGPAVTFVSPTAFTSFEHPPEGIQIQLSSYDGQHRYQTFGRTPGPSHGPQATESWFDIGWQRRDHACDKELDVCVTGRYDRTFILDSPPLLILAIALLGALGGLGCALALILFLRARHGLPAQLQRALQAEELAVWYQPLMRIRDRRLVGAEALARWADEQGHPVSPEVFVPQAERMGLGGLLTRQVLRKTLCDMRARLRDDSGFYVSINITVGDLVDPGFLIELAEQLALQDVAASRIVLEITERTATDHTRLIEPITELRRRGHRIYIDDFGTGYSSLAYLHDLPVDAVKVDRMFTQTIGTGATTATIIDQIGSMARQFQTRLVVEGVETEAQARYAQDLGDDVIGQGWLFGKPVPVQDFPQMDAQSARPRAGGPTMAEVMS